MANRGMPLSLVGVTVQEKCEMAIRANKDVFEGGSINCSAFSTIFEGSDEERRAGIDYLRGLLCRMKKMKAMLLHLEKTGEYKITQVSRHYYKFSHLLFGIDRISSYELSYSENV
jgi:hypothetical protein